jgi:hypothetical protein
MELHTLYYIFGILHSAIYILEKLKSVNFSITITF